MDWLTLIVATQGRLTVPAERLTDDTDLFAAGLDSFGMVKIMLAIENELDTELMDSLLAAENFATIGALRNVVSRP